MRIELPRPHRDLPAHRHFCIYGNHEWECLKPDPRVYGNWAPPVDIYETAGHDLVIKAELPDVNREDVEVTVENNTLTLKGTKSLPTDVKEEQFRRIERRYGSFARSFTLPNTVDATKVSAEFKNGVLTVKLPYREEAKPRTINVDVAA